MGGMEWRENLLSTQYAFFSELNTSFKALTRQRKCARVPAVLKCAGVYEIRIERMSYTSERINFLETIAGSYLGLFRKDRAYFEMDSSLVDTNH